MGQSELWYASQWANSAGSETGDWRPDNRCGANYPLPDGRPGQCNPNGKWPCCSPGGWCGDSDAHCKCSGCTDFRPQGMKDAVKIRNAFIEFTIDCMEEAALGK